jgi:DNA-binding MarR family transcriptional regulator
MTFDPIVANPGRLCILTALAGESAQPFVRLRMQTGLTDGNLATHARRLQSAGFVAIEKTLSQGKPLTTLHLTAQGRRALTAHVQSLVQSLEAKPIPTAVAYEDDSDWVD